MQTSTAPTQKGTTPATLDPNPISHLIEGVKNMVRTNLKPLLATIFASLVVPAFFVIALFAAMTKYTDAQQLWDAIKSSTPVIAIAGFLMLVASLYFWLALNRVILLGARAERASFGSVLGFSLSRLLPTFGVYVALSLAMLLPVAIIGLLMWQMSPLFGLLLLPVLVMYIAASFFLAPLGFVLVESRPLGGLAALLKNMLSLWKHGFLVLFLYILCMNFVSGGMSSIGNGFWSLPSGSNSSSSQYVQPGNSSDDVVQESGENDSIKLEAIKFDFARWVVGVGGIVVLFAVIISTIMQSFLLAGFAHAYDVVDELRRQKTMTTQTA